MMHNLFLENLNGQCVRRFAVNTDFVYLIQDIITKRVLLSSDLENLDREGVEYKILGEFSVNDLTSKGFAVSGLGVIKSVTDDSFTPLIDLKVEKESERAWTASLCFGLILAVVFSLVSHFHVPVIEEVAEEEEKKEHVVKVVKQAPKVRVPKPRRMIAKNVTRRVNTSSVNKVVKRTKNVSRLGALGVLGSLTKKGKQVGGVNLGQAKSSAGPGLGGTKGSGGVQTSLYGKGLVAAPLGAGGNIKGRGGYGTKGKGGGKAGYGSMSLIGSVGTSTIPLGSEAAIEGGGLDPLLIRSVVKKNMGQIRFCYEQGLQSDSSLKGRVAVDFVISPNGKVAKAGVKSTSLHSASVEDCILRRLRSWKFPLTGGGESVKVSYPFLLRRSGQS